jgi:DNA-binding response OmpR family regulator
MHSPVSLNILVVEDNDSLREATVDFLRQNGHRVTGVVSAEDVDDTPMDEIPDLYLVDVNLPGEDGFSLASRLRQAQPAVGIVLMTARGQLRDRLDGYQRGADHYLIKPVEQAELLACISNLAVRLRPLSQALSGQVSLDSKTLMLRGPYGECALKPGEGTLLVALCRAAGHTLERWQAMQLLDPDDKGLVPANLEMRISSLRKKISECSGSEQAIRTLRGHGYALSQPVSIL